MGARAVFSDQPAHNNISTRGDAGEYDVGLFRDKSATTTLDGDGGIGSWVHLEEIVGGKEEMMAGEEDRITIRWREGKGGGRR